MRALPANVGSASGQPGTRLSCPDSGTELRRTLDEPRTIERDDEVGHIPGVAS
jgi:hypothetical protein